MIFLKNKMEETQLKIKEIGPGLLKSFIMLFKDDICVEYLGRYLHWFCFHFFVVVAGFLRKVYGILTAQLALTIIVAGIFMYTESIKGFVQAR